MGKENSVNLMKRSQNQHFSKKKKEKKRNVIAAHMKFLSLMALSELLYHVKDFIMRTFRIASSSSVHGSLVRLL